MKAKFIYILTLLLALNIDLTAQIWLNGFDKYDTVTNKQYNFYEMQEAFNKYWQGKEINHQTPKNERGGWMQFRRWEWFWEQRTFPDGEFPNPMQTYNELMKLRNKKEKDIEVKQSSGWQNIGPATAPGGYNGLGRLNCIEEDPDFDGQNNKTIWVGSASGGLWKTTDDGENWTSNTDKLPSLGVSGICINPDNKNIMYIATGDGDVNDTYSVGVLKSTDGGETWNTTGLNWTIQQNRVIRKLLMHPTDYNTLYAATSIGVLKTTNGGSNWSTLSIPFTSTTDGAWDVEFKPGSPNTLYASSSWEIARSTNAGSNWSLLSSGLPSFDDNTYRIELAVTENDADYIYAVYGYRNYGGGNSNQNHGLYGVYRSTNGGTNWTDVLVWERDGLNLLGWQANGSDLGGQAFYDLAIAASPVNKNIVFVGGVNVWRSTNAGSNWSCVAHWYGQNGVPEVHADHHHLHFAGNSNRLYAGHDGGIDRTTNNGSSWSWLGSGLKITQFYRLGVSQTNSSRTICGSQDNGTKLRNTSTWTYPIGGDGMECIIDYTNANIMWGALYYGQISRSTDGGSNWVGITKPNESGAWVTPYVLHPTNPQTMYAGYQNVWRSTDRGNSWSQLSSNFNIGRLTLLHVAPSNPNFIFAGVNNSLRRTTDGGSNWNSITLPTSRSITYMAIHPDNPNRVWATFSGYTSGQKVYYSTNGGTNWTNVSGSLPNIPVNTIVYQKNRDNRVYVGTDLGVFYRDDNTNDWIEFNEDLPNVIVNELEIQEEDNLLFAATYGRGLWSVSLPPEYVELTAPTLANPADNAVNITLNANLSWNSVASATGYQLQVSLNSDFSTTVANVNQTALSYGINNYNPEYSTSYFWRVRAKRGAEEGPWSATRKFTTEPIPLVAPNLASPADNATNIALNTALSWSGVTGADNYQIQVSLSSNFSTTVANVTQGSLTYNISNFNPQYSTAYFWRVRAKRGAEDGPWSSERKFTTEPIPLVAPNLSSPADNANPVAINSNLTWGAVTGADNYQVQVSVNNNFGTTVLNSTQNSLAVSLTTANLDYSTVYYWRVRAKRGDEDGPWASYRTFTTEPIPLVAPNLANPADNSTNVSINSILSWNSVTGADNYQIQVSLNSNFEQLLANTTQMGLNYAISNFNPEYSTKYYWRVRAKRGAEEGPWASFRNFTTEPIPLVAPQLTSPVDNADNITINSSLNWNSVAGAENYQVQVSTNSNFSSLVADAAISGLTYSLSNVNLQYSTTYYWRVRAKRGDDNGPWASFRTFTTEPIPLVAPVLSSPNNNSVNIALNSSLNWNSVSGADNYQLQVSLSQNFDNNLVNTTQAGLTYSISNFNPEYSTTYFWRVRAKRGDEAGPWADARNFTTQPIPLVAPQLTNPDDNADRVAINSSLNWNSVTGADSYQVQVSITNTFLSTLANATTEDLSYGLSNVNLNYSTAYYWRVRAKRGAENGPWSSGRKFTTEPIPLVAPNLSNPQNDAVNIAINSSLSWSSVTGANGYELLIAADSEFSDIISNVNQGTLNYSLANSNLEYSTKYFWKVRAKRNDELGPWSVTRNFTTQPIPLVAPVLVTPTHLQTNVAVNSDLIWESVNGATGYQVQVSLVSTFTTLVGDNITTELDYNLSSLNLNYQTNYFWRVRAKRNDENGPWASARRFTTQPIPLVAPQLLNPDDLAENVQLNAVLSWGSVTGANSYRIQISDASDFSNILANEIVTALSFSLNQINPDYSTSYYWRVLARRNQEEGPWADYRTLTTIPPPLVAPVLAAPENNSVNIALNANLSWNSVQGADGYNLQISLNSNFNNFVENLNLNQLTFSLSNSDIEYSTVYYWRVRAKRDDETGAWSSVFQFATEPIPLVAPNLISPDNNQLNVLLSENLSWNNVQGADNYQLQISLNSDFNDVFSDVTMQNNEYKIQNSNPEYSTKYFWRARAKRGNENGPWSVVWNFTTEPIPLVAPMLQSPANNAIKVLLNALLNWNQVAGAETYFVQISKSEDFTNPIFSQTAGNNLSIDLSLANPEFLTEYFWRVKAVRQGESGPYSTIFKFTTRQFLQPPTLVYPQNIAENIMGGEKLSWTDVEDADKYSLQYSTDPNFIDNITVINNIENIELLVSTLNLPVNQTIYWRVRAVNILENSNWSSSRSFKTYNSTNHCDAKSLSCDLYISEVNISDLSYTSNCNWGYSDFYNTNSATVLRKSAYQLIVKAVNSNAQTTAKVWFDWNNDNIFNNANEEYSLTNAGNGIFNLNLTIPENAVMNKIRARIAISNNPVNSPCGIINSGEFEDFAMVIQPALLLPPDLISPLNNSKDVELKAELVWDVVDEADSYILQIAVNQNFNNIVYQLTTNSSSAIIPEGTLLYRTNYFWRVKSINDETESNFSQVWKFTTEISVPDNWAFTPNTGLSSIIRVPVQINPKIGNRNIENGDAIGLFFDNNGNDVCAGYGIWNNATLEITVWGDNPNTLQKDGFAAGEKYRFKLWDSKLDLVYPASANYESGPDEFVNNSLSILSSLESSIKIQLISLKFGWNMISSYIKPLQPDMSVLWNDIIDDVVIVKDGFGETFIPDFDINNIGNWKLYDGYQVYMRSDAVLPIGGVEAIPEDEEINLPFGWSLISYLRNSSMNAETALQTLTNNNKLVIAKDNMGNPYIPEWDINAIGNMLPGQGYQIYLNQAEKLVYPPNVLEKAAFDNKRVTNIKADYLLPDAEYRGENMLIVVGLDNADESMEIGVYNRNVLIGSGRLINGRAFITIWKDAVENNLNEFTLRAYDRVSGSMSDIKISNVSNFLSGQTLQKLTYNTDGVYYLNGTVEFDLFTASVSANPNPFNVQCEIAVYLPESSEVTVKLYNSTGVEVMELVNGNLNSGRRLFTISSSELASGEYIVVMNYRGQKISKKIILTK